MIKKRQATIPATAIPCIQNAQRPILNHLIFWSPSFDAKMKLMSASSDTPKVIATAK